jgi:Mn2+/Fe2+ NRAMP family transporter
MACEPRTATNQAIGFYSVIGVAIATGLSLNFLHIDPVKALYWSAILNGVAAPLMAVIMMMASNRKVMGKFVIPRYLRWVGWCATIVMLCVCFGVVLSWKA